MDGPRIALGANFTESDPRAWYVIQTQSRCEYNVERALTSKGLEIFLPQLTVPSRRRDRKLLLNVPLFPSYLFVHADLEVRTYYQILKAKGVVRLLGSNGNPIPVSEEKLYSIKAIVAGDYRYYPWRYLDRGMQVRVVEGPLAGAVGLILKKKEKKRRLVVAVELFHRSVAVELEDEAVERLS